MNFGFGHGHHGHHHGHHHHHHHHHGHHHHNNGGGLLLGAALLGAVAGAAVANSHNDQQQRVVVVGPPPQTVHPASVAMHQARPVQVQMMAPAPPVASQPSFVPSAPPGPAVANCMACRSPIQFQRTGAACQVRCYNCPTINTFY